MAAARDGAEAASAFNNKKSWIVALYRVMTTSTPASINLRPYASPSSRKTSFSAVTMRVRGNPSSCFVADARVAWRPIEMSAALKTQKHRVGGNRKNPNETTRAVKLPVAACYTPGLFSEAPGVE